MRQFAFVNGRAVRDKVVSGALRAAYMDFLPSDRHAVVALYVECDAREVDVNVHPAKAEVRFRDSGLIRGLVVGAVKQRLSEALHRATTTGGTATILAMRPPPGLPARAALRRLGLARLAGRAKPCPRFRRTGAGKLCGFCARRARRPPSRPRNATFPPRSARPARRCMKTTSSPRRATGSSSSTSTPRTNASSTRNSSASATGAGIERQALLTPLVVDLDPDEAALIEERAEELAALGLVVEGFGPGAILVREAPAVLAGGDIAGLVRDLAADLAAEDGAQSLARRLDRRLATFACHHSVRSGRALKPEEMNALLREMETTPGAGQCNHGRPTYVELKLADIERLFGRR